MLNFLLDFGRSLKFDLTRGCRMLVEVAVVVSTISSSFFLVVLGKLGKFFFLDAGGNFGLPARLANL